MWVFICINTLEFFIWLASTVLLYLILYLKLFIKDIITLHHFPTLRIEIPCNLTVKKKNLKMHFYDSLLTKIIVFANSFEGKWQIGFSCQGLFEIISLKIGLIKMTWKIREFYMSKWKSITKNKCCHQNGLGITDQKKKKKYHMFHGLESMSQYCQFHQQN